MRQLTVALLAVGMILALSPSTVWAEGYEVTRPGAELGAFFDPNWPGTKLFGPLSIVYEFVAGEGDEGNNCLTIEMHMVFALRLKKGNKDYVFGDRRNSMEMTDPLTDQPIPICLENPVGQVAALVGFFKETVIPILYPINSSVFADNSRLKSVSNVTQTLIPTAGPGETFMVTSRDVDLAVKE